MELSRARNTFYCLLAYIQEREVTLIFLDIAFIRALLSIHSTDEDLCVIRKKGNLTVCRNAKNKYTDILDIPNGEFATGWQSYSGTNGVWVTWNNIKEIPKETESELSEVQFDQKSPTSHNPEKNNCWTSTLDRNLFTKTVDNMKHDMERGEYFLANLTRIVECEKNIDPLYVAIASCLNHTTPFRFYSQIDGCSILGLSPERFVKIEGDSIICEPMKGTSKSSTSLLSNNKEFVENTMMIDLVRSDLSRICVPESIKLIRRDHITQHPGLFQMDSTIGGQLLSGMSMTSAVRNLMPVASVTGTPKPHVLKVIDRYEPHKRKNYCGSYGWIDNKNKECDLAVSIRIIEMDRGHTQIGVGSGITIESDSDSEFEETELKASRLRLLVDQASAGQVGEVFTSLSIDESRSTFALEKHCKRLARHAEINQIEVAASDIEAEVEKFIPEATIGFNSYLRISIAADGDIRCEIASVDIEPSPLILGLAPIPFSYAVEIPKFTNRFNYNNAFSIAQNLTDTRIDDAMLIARGYISETTRANIFLRNGKEVFIPNPQVGLIRGIAHENVCEHLEGKGINVTVRNIKIKDILQADEMITTNSVRGIQRVQKISSCLLKEDKIFADTENILFENSQGAFKRD